MFVEYDAIEPDEWEVDLANLTFMGELGRGNFGQVVEGRLRKVVNEKEVEVKVAIKVSTRDLSIHMYFPVPSMHHYRQCVPLFICFSILYWIAFSKVVHFMINNHCLNQLLHVSPDLAFT